MKRRGSISLSFGSGSPDAPGLPQGGASGARSSPPTGRLLFSKTIASDLDPAGRAGENGRVTLNSSSRHMPRSNKPANQPKLTPQAPIVADPKPYHGADPLPKSPGRNGLRVATWNINSVRLRIDLVRKLIATANPDVICLQEIKTEDQFFPAEDIKQA